ncbi:uncharacterized protein N7482_008806 [Penicillium canariense]|uniref:Uncharacterized protein n=1 Tax=Penicillium canariense TaxID=189055 RepID=A0A9W9LHV7_9EURO|nr:uncharacterized protein N7482_008806 [Penicillium canariense]KAJ5157706.1 hypothetical protein N7482_008806 [Penicillium canariense]
MEILVHVSAPSTARDDARYRAQVAAIRAFEPVSRQLLAPDGGLAPAAAPESTDSSLLQASGLISAPSPVPRQSAEAAAAAAGEGEVARKTSTDSCYDRDLNAKGQQKPPGDCPESALAPAPNSNSNPRPCPRRDPRPILVSPETNQIGPSPLVPVPTDRRERHPLPEPDSDSLESLVSVIPDSQPEISYESVHRPSTPSASSAAPLHEESGARPSKRRRVESPLPTSQTIGVDAASHSVTTARSAHDTEKASSRTNRPTAPLVQYQGSQTHPVSAASAINPPRPIPIMGMAMTRLNPARTYKPTHQARELDKLERGYWAVRINVAATDVEEREQERNQKPAAQQGQANPRKESWGAPQRDPNDWRAAEFARFWAFLSDFVTAEARAGWGVWCIVERVESEGEGDGDGDGAADNAVQPVLLKVYAWGEVAMHIYLLLFLASERRVRGMGLRWIDSWEKTVIQMP